MAKKGGKKGNGMVVSKVKRANHMKHKKKPAEKKTNTTRPNQKKNENDKPQRKAKDKTPVKSPKAGVKKSEKKAASKKVVIPRNASEKKKAANGKLTALKMQPNGVVEDVFEADEMLDMMDEEDIDYFAKKANKRPASNEDNGDIDVAKKNRRKNNNNHVDIEDEYDEELFTKNKDKKSTRPLLPIKTREGIVERSIEIDELSDEEEDEEEEEEKEAEPLSMAEIYARRKQKIEELKAVIGSSSSSIIENPEERMENISAVLKLYKGLTADVYITGFKLVSASLVELFKDLAPQYEIKNTGKPGEKLKKATRVVYAVEGRLLKYYQMFLKKLEGSFSIVKEGKKEKKCEEPKKRVAVFALKCMADLLIAMPYFNFAKNVVHALIPFTAHKNDEIRSMICGYFRKLFKEDKRGEISLHAVRQINHLIKNKRHHQISPDCLDILLALRIKDVNLDQEREEEIQRYKTLTRKEKLLIMSKNERRRKKKIERLEKEIVAAKAERNKESKTKFQTETVKLVFTIYFRILKMAPKSGLMGVVIRGLAKFAHTINVDFFTDLVETFNSLIARDQLGYQQCLYAIQVVLIMLSDQGEALNIDPIHFYSHLYGVLFHLTAGPSNSDVPVALDCLENMLIKRRKKVSIHRVLAFTKRISTLALQVQHNGTIALLNLVRILMMTHRQTDVLLDIDSTAGSGSFLAELGEPEHCNAGSTALWELHSLTRHYHPIVEKFARHLLSKCPTTGNGQLSLELSRRQVFHTYF